VTGVQTCALPISSDRVGTLSYAVGYDRLRAATAACGKEVDSRGPIYKKEARNNILQFLNSNCMTYMRDLNNFNNGNKMSRILDI